MSKNEGCGLAERLQSKHYYANNMKVTEWIPENLRGVIFTKLADIAENYIPK